jgi:transcriptional regulator with GAF, ATPase, and Fis domain
MSGEVFPLTSSEITFGRDAENTICFPDPALSRRHCAFIRTDQGWTVRDLQSSNGTFVNGVQITNHHLAEGDRVSIGSSVLLFVNAAPASSPDVELVDGEITSRTSRLPIDETRYLQRTATGGTSRVEHGLRALLTISTAINALRSEDELHRELLRLLREVVPVDGAAIVLPRAEGDLQVMDGGGPAPVQVSRSIVQRVLTDRAGVLSGDATVSRSFAVDARSIGDVRSLMCVPIAVRQTSLGAIYLVSPQRAAFDDEHLQLVTAMARIAAIAIENVRHVAALERETERLHADLGLSHNIVGESPPMQRAYERLARLARADTTALIIGETGTGKELAARAIHANSVRARRPFVAINCAALTDTLLESELFGHERGAFTGAVVQKKGRIELADGGTLFLDEIGELALPLQGKLLRVLQEREFERVGGTRPLKVDVRLISATNRNLIDEVRAGRFREDLYFRLNVVALEMPPLRERRADIPALARHFMNRYAPKAGRRLRGISPEALAFLTAYEWPGNVRELENAIERAVVLGSTEDILPEDLPEAVVDAGVAPAPGVDEGSFHGAVVETKKAAIVQAFRAAGGNYTEAARRLGIHPNYLHRLVRNLGLKPTLTAGS